MAETKKYYRSINVGVSDVEELLDQAVEEGWQLFHMVSAAGTLLAILEKESPAGGGKPVFALSPKKKGRLLS